MNTTKPETTACALVCAALLLAVVAPGGLVAQRRYESITWTPDGNALTVAWRGDSAAGDLYVLPLGERAVRRLTADPARDAFASWAPDGSAVAFASSRTGGGDVYVAARDGSNPRRLTHSDSTESWPSWSPDGKHIAFMSKQMGRWQIWVMAADGSEQRRVTQSTRNDFNPRWSPDGRWLVFESDRDGGNQDEIYVIAADGTGERRLTHSAGNDIYPDWSPLGDRIAYCAVESGRAFIWTMSPDGSDARLLVEDACMPTWSPRGDRLAYQTAERGRPAVLRIARPDGSPIADVSGPFERDSASTTRPRLHKPNVAILIYDGVQIIDHAAPWEVFGQYALNNVFTVAKDTTPVTTYMGMRVLPSYGFANHPKPDVIVIPGGNTGGARRDAETIAWIRSNAAGSRYVLGICSGVMLLAEAALLEGRRATTFYNLLDDLQKRNGAITVVEDTLVVEDGKFTTTTGTGGMQGALRVLAHLHGSAWARVVALNMEFEPLPQEQRTPRAFLADMNLPSSVYAHFPWREAELVRYEGDTSRWSMIWRFADGETAAVAERLRGGLTAEGWRNISSTRLERSWRSAWGLRGRDEGAWTADVTLTRLPNAGHELAIEVRRATR